jgi:hypothetical protein
MTGLAELPFILHFHSRNYFPGERVEGTVEINILLAKRDNIDRIRIILKGETRT